MERKPFGKDNDPREAQAKSVIARKANKERRAAIMAAFSTDGMTAQDAAQFDAMLLMATRRELVDIATNEALPADIRRRARILVKDDDGDAVEMGELLRNRAFGKPKQITELDGSLQTEQPIVFNGLPDTEND